MENIILPVVGVVFGVHGTAGKYVAQLVEYCRILGIKCEVNHD